MARRFNPPPLRQNSGWTLKILTWGFPYKQRVCNKDTDVAHSKNKLPVYPEFQIYLRSLGKGKKCDLFFAGEGWDHTSLSLQSNKPQLLHESLFPLGTVWEVWGRRPTTILPCVRQRWNFGPLTTPALGLVFVLLLRRCNAQCKDIAEWNHKKKSVNEL